MSFSFPEPIKPAYAPAFTYPSNLTTDGRSYFTKINFIKYQPAYGKGAINSIKDSLPNFISYNPLDPLNLVNTELFTVNSAGDSSTEELINLGTRVGNSITLPIPRKVNEMNMMHWTELSLSGAVLDAAKGLASSLAPRITSAVAEGIKLSSSFLGLQINPFIMQYFQKPSLREFSFSWTMAPRNRKESEEINKIIYELKAAQAPRLQNNDIIMEYPDLAILEFFPDDEFQIKLKPCVILGISVDYTPAGPSYIDGTSAPSLINLTINLRETKLWWSHEWRENTYKFQKTGQGGLEDRASGRASLFTSSETEVE